MPGDDIIAEVGKPVTGVTCLMDNNLTRYKSRNKPVTGVLHFVSFRGRGRPLRPARAAFTPRRRRKYGRAPLDFPAYKEVGKWFDLV